MQEKELVKAAREYSQALAQLAIDRINQVENQVDLEPHNEHRKLIEVTLNLCIEIIKNSFNLKD